MEVKINKDIREFSESIFFGLGLSQPGSGGRALICGIRVIYISDRKSGQRKAKSRQNRQYRRNNFFQHC